MKELANLLRAAIHAKNLAAVNSAIEAGAEIDADLSNYGYTNTIFGALYRGDINVMGYRALHFAVKEGSYDIVELLLKKKANPNVGNAIGNTPLHLAIWLNRPEIVKLLLDNGANINQVNIKGVFPAFSYASTPLHYGIEYGDEKMVKLLLSYSPKLDICDANGDNAHAFAIRLQHDSLAKLIVDQIYPQAQSGTLRP